MTSVGIREVDLQNSTWVLLCPLRTPAPPFFVHVLRESFFEVTFCGFFLLRASLLIRVLRSFFFKFTFCAFFHAVCVAVTRRTVRHKEAEKG